MSVWCAFGLGAVGMCQVGCLGLCSIAKLACGPQCHYGVTVSACEARVVVSDSCVGVCVCVGVVSLHNNTCFYAVCCALCQRKESCLSDILSSNCFLIHQGVQAVYAAPV